MVIRTLNIVMRRLLVPNASSPLLLFIILYNTRVSYFFDDDDDETRVLISQSKCNAEPTTLLFFIPRWVCKHARVTQTPPKQLIYLSHY